MGSIFFKFLTFKGQFFFNFCRNFESCERKATIFFSHKVFSAHVFSALLSVGEFSFDASIASYCLGLLFFKKPSFFIMVYSVLTFLFF